MAINNNTIKTRIQLKSDTEANWNKAGPKENSNGFIPLSGELIIYSADAAHPFSRLKVGDGVTNVVKLPFIDAGTLNGNDVELVKVDNFTNFPSPGSPDKLYVDLTNNCIYHYTTTNGYSKLSNFTYTARTEVIKDITKWDAGIMTTVNVENNVLTVFNGTRPQLGLVDLTVVTGITKEGE